MSNVIDFLEARDKALARSRESIGTYQEKTLHHTLKLYYGGEFATEAKVGRYVADVVREDGIYEIQSKAFFRIKEKLKAFLTVTPVSVVYPIKITKNILWTDIETGEIVSRSKSPKKGSVYNILPELYALKDFLKEPDLTFIAVLVNCDEYRYADGFGKDKKKRASKVDIIPTELIEEIFLKTPEDYKLFFPETLPEIFTSADYSKETKLRLSDSQKSLLVLTELGLIKRIGNKGRSILYSFS